MLGFLSGDIEGLEDACGLRSDQPGRRRIGKGDELNKAAPAPPVPPPLLRPQPRRMATAMVFFLLQHYDAFLQVAGVFSKFRPTGCTYRSDPDSCRLAYGTALFRPIECKQLLMDVSCVPVHSLARCISSHRAGAFPLLF